MPQDETARQAEAALQDFKRALARDPRDAAGYVGIAQAYRSLGQHEAALAHYAFASQLKPQDLDILAAFAGALLQMRYYKDAATKFAALVKARPDQAEAQFGLGAALLALRDFAPAADHLTRADALRPGHVDTLRKLGIALGKLDRPEEALAKFDAALVIDPGEVNTRVERVDHLVRLGRIAEARAESLALAKDHPDHLSALYLCAQNAATGGAEDDDKIAALKALEAGDPPKSKQIFVQFGLAQFLRKRKAYDEEFAHLARGNALKRSMTPYDEAREIAAIRAIAEAYPAARLAEKAGLGDPSEVPVFIVGMPRSGTTLVEQILASHPKVFGAGELQDFAEVTGCSTCRPPQIPFDPAALDGAKLRELGRAYVARLSARAPGAARVTNKLPANYLFLGLIHLMLPRAKIVHVRRDPLDTCFSCYSRLFFSSIDFSYDLGELGRHYRAYGDLMAHWRAVLPQSAMHEVQYESLIDDFEPEVRRLVAFCGLDWDPACLDFYKSRRHVDTASAMQVRQPLYKSSVGSAAPYAAHLGPLIDALKG